MHVEICDVSCVLVKTVKTQKQIKYKKKVTNASCINWKVKKHFWKDNRIERLTIYF